VRFLRSCKKFGRQSWIIASIIITEFLIVLRFDLYTVTKPIPQPVASVWAIGIISLAVWTFWKFYILRDVKNDVPQING
jgi:phosphatidylserine synthase 2